MNAMKINGVNILLKRIINYEAILSKVCFYFHPRYN